MWSMMSVLLGTHGCSLMLTYRYLDALQSARMWSAPQALLAACCRFPGAELRIRARRRKQAASRACGALRRGKTTHYPGFMSLAFGRFITSAPNLAQIGNSPTKRAILARHMSTTEQSREFSKGINICLEGAGITIDDAYSQSPLIRAAFCTRTSRLAWKEAAVLSIEE
jgi:hypothetical protein